jgi:AcrR family transcriptional regulator
MSTSDSIQSRAAPTGDGRERILHAAIGLFARKGFHAVSVSDVADAAGLVKSAIYHHFPSKEALYAAVLDETCQNSRDQMAAGARGDSWRERLRGAVFVLARLLRPGSHVLNLVFEGIAHAYAGTLPSEKSAVASLRREFTHVLAKEIAAGIDKGDLQAVDPELASLCLIGVVAAALQAGPGTSEETRISFALELFLHGIARRRR